MVDDVFPLLAAEVKPITLQRTLHEIDEVQEVMDLDLVGNEQGPKASPMG